MASFSVNFSKQTWFPKYLASIIIWGLVLSHSIVEYATVCILMLYLTKKLGLLLAAIIINVLDGLSAVFMFPFAYVVDHFNVIVFSTGSYVMGLVLLLIIAQFPERTEFSMFYLAAVLIALGKSGRSSLQSFLGYQLRERSDVENADSGNSRDQRQRDVGTKIWWHSAWISGCAVAVSPLFHDSDPSLNLEILAPLMGATILWFYLGFMLYDYQKPARMSLARVCKVLKPAEPIKLLLWATFIPYSLVLATGNTLFIAQVSNLDTRIGNSFRVRYSSLFVIKSFTCDLVVLLFWYWGRSKGATHRGKVTLVRIGAGMVCAVLCCVAAQQVEILRRHSIREEGILKDPNKKRSMTVLVLTPQYFLLGLMEGLAGGGLFTYIIGLVPGSRRNLAAEPFSELVLCVGKFLSIPFVLIFRSWIDHNINTSQVDRYFLVLAIASSVMFCLHLLWALKYGGSATDIENGESINILTPVKYGHSAQQEEYGHKGKTRKEKRDDEQQEEDEEAPNIILEAVIEEISEEQRYKKLGRRLVARVLSACKSFFY